MKILALLFILTPAIADAQDIILTPDICAQSIVHEPREDVRYVADEDTTLETQALTLEKIIGSEYIEFPLTLDLNEYLAATNAVENIVQEAPLGAIRVYTNGRVTYNGEEITNHIDKYCNQYDPDSKKNE